MRILFFVLLYLFLAVCKSEDYQADFVIGERQEGDYPIFNKFIWKPPLCWKSMVATISMKPRSEYEVLTCVRITNIANKMIKFIPLTTNLTTQTNITIKVVGKLGEGISVYAEAFAKSILTTPAPSTTINRLMINNEKKSISDNSEENNGNVNDNASNADDKNNGASDAGNGNNSAPDTDDGNNSGPDDGDGNNNGPNANDGNNSAPDTGDGNNSVLEDGDGNNSALESDEENNSASKDDD